MDFPKGTDNPYGYYDEQQGGYYEECYSPDHGRSNCSDYSYDPQDYCYDKYSEICAGMEDQPRSNWEDLLEIYIAESSQT